MIFKSLIQLAAPHTWPASVLPVLLAATLTLHDCPEKLSPVVLFILMAISILMQSAANTLNDYCDFVKGADSLENQPDPEDSALVYNHINPNIVLFFFLVLLASAGALGAYIVWISSWSVLIIGVIGALTVSLYSLGKTPISYLPVGEFVSGFVMGGLITLACSTVLTGTLNWYALLFSIPLIIGIGLIMCTNNTCDIEKDRLVNRRTFSALVGRPWARWTYHLFVCLWGLSIVAIIGIYFPHGWIILPIGLIASYPLLRVLFKNPLTLNSRIAAMGQILTLNLVLTAFYVIAILVDVIAK